MKKFIISSLYFLLILVVLNLVLNFYGNKVYLGTYKDYSLNFNSYLLSDSHGLPLKRHTEIYGVYNFSAESESYFDMKRKLNYLVNNTRVDTVYITVEDHTLSPYRESNNNLDRSIYYATEADYDNMFIYLKEKLIYNIAFFQPKKRTVLRKYLLSFFRREENELLKLKTRKSWYELNKEERIHLSKVRFDAQFPTKLQSTELKKALESIIQVCKENNIVLIGLLFPLSNNYITEMGDTTYGAHRIFKENKLQVLNYKTSFKNKDENFSDQDHINEKGATELIELLFTDTKKDKMQDTGNE